MRNFSLLGGFLVVLGSMLGGCSHNAETRPFAPLAPALDTRPAEPLNISSLEDRRVQLARHAILQLNHLIEGLNLAMSFRLDERMQISDGSESLVSGCRVVNKIGPGFDRDYDSSVEELRLSYVKCEPERVGSTQMASANLQGQSVFTVVYDKPYPRQSSPSLTLGYPVFVGQRSGPIAVELNHHSGAKTRVTRLARFSANRIESGDSDQVLLLAGEIVDTFNFQGAKGEAPRKGRVQVDLSDVMVRVSKGTRRVESVKVGSFSLNARTESTRTGSTSDGKAKGAPARDVQKTELILSSPAAMAVSKDACEPVAGRFDVEIDGLSAGQMWVKDSRIGFESDEAREFKLCGHEEDVYFLDEFERAFF